MLKPGDVALDRWVRTGSDTKACKPRRPLPTALSNGQTRRGGRTIDSSPSRYRRVVAATTGLRWGWQWARTPPARLIVNAHNRCALPLPGCPSRCCPLTGLHACAVPADRQPCTATPAPDQTQCRASRQSCARLGEAAPTLCSAYVFRNPFPLYILSSGGYPDVPVPIYVATQGVHDMKNLKEFEGDTHTASAPEMLCRSVWYYPLREVPSQPRRPLVTGLSD